MNTAQQLVRRFVEELWNERRLEVADEIFAEGCVTHQLRSGVPLTPARRGPKALKEHISAWLVGFPDLRFVIEQTIAEGDCIMSRLVMEGTHRGSWLGISPTGKKLQIRMITVHRIANDKIAEDWVLVESLGLFQQLGALPDTTEILRSFAQHANDCSDGH